MAHFDFLFDKVNKVITVPAPTVNLDVQDLYDECREYEANLWFLDDLEIVRGGGKDDLGNGLLSALTVTLINDWRLAFEARPGPDTESVTVYGGNLVAVNAYGNNPIYPTAFTQVTIAQAVSAALIEAPDLAWLALFHRDGLRVTDDETGQEILYADRTTTTVDSTWDLYSDDELTVPWDGVASIKGRQPST
jgi:hypothetical protein